MRLLISSVVLALLALAGCSEPAARPPNKIAAAMPAPSAPLPPPSALAVVPPPSWDFVRDVGDRLYFYKGDAILTAAALAQINKWSHFLDAHPDSKLLLEGHTDPRGSDKFNRALGLKRAGIIKTRLIRHGVAANRLSTKSLGASQPAVKGSGEKAWRLDRRVVAIPQ